MHACVHVDLFVYMYPITDFWSPPFFLAKSASHDITEYATMSTSTDGDPTGCVHPLNTHIYLYIYIYYKYIHVDVCMFSHDMTEYTTMSTSRDGASAQYIFTINIYM